MSANFLTTYQPYTPLLVERGPFLPAQVPTKLTDMYEGLQYGWMIGGNMGLVAGDFNKFRNGGDDGANRPIPNPVLFNRIPQINTEDLLNQAAAAGVDYIVPTIKNEWSFSMYSENSRTNMPQQLIPTRPNNGQFLSPAYPDGYHMLPGADVNYMDRLRAGTRARGMKLGAYFNMVDCLVIAEGYSFLTNSVSGFTSGVLGVPLAVQQGLVNYWARCLQEAIMRFDLDIVWLDYGGPLPENRIPEWARLLYYNAAKSVKPDVFVMANTMGDTTLGPADGQSLEHDFFLYYNPPRTTFDSKYATFQGRTSYRANEVVGTPITYFYYLGPNAIVPENNFEGRPDYRLVPRADMQRVIDACHQYKCPYLANILIKDDGQLYQRDIDYLNTFQFRRTPFVPPSPAQPPAPTGLAANGRQVSFQQAPGTVATDYEYEFIEQA